VKRTSFFTEMEEVLVAAEHCCNNKEYCVDGKCLYLHIY